MAARIASASNHLKRRMGSWNQHLGDEWLMTFIEQVDVDSVIIQVIVVRARILVLFCDTNHYLGFATTKTRIGLSFGLETLRLVRFNALMACG